MQHVYLIKDLFEMEENDDSRPFLHLDPAIYPMYPNAAGVRFIDLIKHEWSSSETGTDFNQRNYFVQQLPEVFVFPIYDLLVSVILKIIIFELRD